MSVTYGTFQGSVVLEDEAGRVGSIPFRVLPTIAHDANMSDFGRASWAGRSYDRDLLTSAAGQLKRLELAELAPCALCHDNPATEGDWCARCTSGAQGSGHDDRHED